MPRHTSNRNKEIAEPRQKNVNERIDERGSDGTIGNASEPTSFPRGVTHSTWQCDDSLLKAFCKAVKGECFAKKAK